MSKRSQRDLVVLYLMSRMEKAINAYDKAVENNEKMKLMLDQFIGKPETYQLDNAEVKRYLSSNIPDLKSVLRVDALGLIYKPVNAAMSLVLRAGIEKGTKGTFELIKESVTKINLSC